MPRNGVCGPVVPLPAFCPAASSTAGLPTRRPGSPGRSARSRLTRGARAAGFLSLRRPACPGIPRKVPNSSMVCAPAAAKCTPMPLPRFKGGSMGAFFLTVFLTRFRKTLLPNSHPWRKNGFQFSAQRPAELLPPPWPFPDLREKIAKCPQHRPHSIPDPSGRGHALNTRLRLAIFIC